MGKSAYSRSSFANPSGVNVNTDAPFTPMAFPVGFPPVIPGPVFVPASVHSTMAVSPLRKMRRAKSLRSGNESSAAWREATIAS